MLTTINMTKYISPMSRSVCLCQNVIYLLPPDRNTLCQLFIKIYVHMSEYAVCVAGLAAHSAAAAADCWFLRFHAARLGVTSMAQSPTGANRFCTRVSRECSRRRWRQTTWVNTESSSSCKKKKIPTLLRFVSLSNHCTCRELGPRPSGNLFHSQSALF